jgi:hypothetical protein
VETVIIIFGCCVFPGPTITGTVALILLVATAFVTGIVGAVVN